MTLFKRLEAFKTGVILLILLALASVVAMVLTERFPSGVTTSDLKAAYGNHAGQALQWLRVTDPYRSWWYLALLTLLALNLTLCTVRRLPSALRLAWARPSPPGPRSLSRDRSFNLELSAGADKVAATAMAVLRGRKYDALERSYPEGIHGIAGQKHPWQRLGASISHLGIIILVAGGLVSSIGGFRTLGDLSVGEERQVPGRDFSIRLDRFEIARSEGGQISDYYSTLAVIENGKEVLSKVIEVNDPLTYQGISFYQSTYGAEPRSFSSLELGIRDKAEPGSSMRPVTLAPGDTVDIGGDRAVTVADFSIDFRMDSQGMVFAASPEPRNPAARIVVLESGKAVAESWMFFLMPEFHGSDQFGSLDIQVLGFEPLYYSGIEISYSPGTPIIFLGFLIASLGISIGLGFRYERMRLLIVPAEDGASEVLLDHLKGPWYSRIRGAEVTEILDSIKTHAEGENV